MNKAKPKRTQRRRDKGSRPPEGTIYVGRPTKWGNPFDWGKYIQQPYRCSDRAARHMAVGLYKDWLAGDLAEFQERRDKILADMAELQGHDLSCWCPLDEPCHADILLALANETPIWKIFPVGSGSSGELDESVV